MGTFLICWQTGADLQQVRPRLPLRGQIRNVPIFRDGRSNQTFTSSVLISSSALALALRALRTALAAWPEANSLPASVHSFFRLSKLVLAVSNAALSMPLGYLRVFDSWSTRACSFSTIGGTLAVR